MSATRRPGPRHLAAAGVAAGALVLAACGGGGGGGNSAAGSSGQTPKVAAVIKGLDNPFFQTMEQGINDQAKASGVPTTVQAAASITDTTGQADKLSGLANQDYSCYIVNPISGTNLIQGLAQLAAKNKTIVNIDSPVDPAAAKAANATPATYIGTDNNQAGQMAGQEMLKVVPSGTVGVIGGIAGDVTSGARIDGFSHAVSGKLTVLPTVAADWDRQTALTKASDVIRAHPDVAGFFVANDDMGLGVARAIADAGKTGQIKVVSVDGITDALNAVKSGDLTATVAQYPYVIGKMGVEACTAAAKGQSLQSNVKAPVELVTKDVADKALAATPKPFGTYDDPFSGSGK